MAARLEQGTDATAVAAVTAVPLRIDGEPRESFLVDTERPDRFVTVLEGRLPSGPTEVMLGSATFAGIDRGIGDMVLVESLEADVGRELMIVGRGVFPDIGHPALLDSDIGDYNDFAILSDAATDLVSSDSNEYFGLVLVDWASGDARADGEAVLARAGAERREASTPATLANYEHVTGYPGAVAVFVAAVAVLAASHALTTSVRQRGRDLALLRALGYTPSQVRSAISWQAATFAAAGIVIGVPLGVLIGRSAWRVVAGNLGIDSYVPTPWTAILLTVPAAFALARLLAISPGLRAVRRSPAETLRTE